MTDEFDPHFELMSREDAAELLASGYRNYEPNRHMRKATLAGARAQVRMAAPERELTIVQFDEGGNISVVSKKTKSRRELD